MKRPDGVTVTLCMIVKDETHIIKECLESMLPYIDRYDITDTGSTDGTPELIKEFMDTHGVPGEVYMSDWKGFGKSRTEALENCQGKANYAWMIDADDKITGNFNYPPEMDADSYSIRLGRPDFSWFRNQIFKVDDPSRKWHYVGVLHEYATMIDIPPEQMKIVKWDAGNYFLEARTLGNRNVGIDPVEKYTRDAETLKSALTNPEDPYYEPTNVRYQFYLAQSYFDSQQWDKSLEAYQKRAEMGGWEEEIWFSLFRVAIIRGILGETWPAIKESYLEAYNFRPNRAEPLYEISRAYRSMDKPRLAYIYAKMGCEIPYPAQDILFIAQDVYDWKMLDEFGSTAFYAGDVQNGHRACQMLENKLGMIPSSEHGRIQSNKKSYEEHMLKVHQHNQQIIERQKAEKKKEKEDKKKKPKLGTKVAPRSSKIKKNK